ncbi:MAG: tetratricopeptide repeat protein [Gemmatimonadaceae bacterium]
MTAGSQRAALDAIHSARPIIARLSMARDSEDLAADLIDAWTATETGLRSLIGGSSLTGQMLIRELRQRHFLSLEQANALAEFHAARERAARVDYKPTEGDVNASRDAFLKLEAGLMGEPSAAAPASPPASPASGPTAAAPAGAAAASAAAAQRARGGAYTPDGPLDPSARERFEGAPVAVPAERTRPRWLMPLLGLVALLVVGGIAAYALMGRRGSAAFDNGVKAYREGRREAAAGEFLKATKDNPNDPMPHVYLARMAREAGNMTTANTEAVTAVRLGPNSGVALRELASVSFVQQNYDAARRFYLRAVQSDTSDRLSQGFLGCSLVRLGRIDEGMRWISRAGAGAWSSCAPPPGSVAAPGMRTGVPGMQAVPPAGSLPPATGQPYPR